MTSHQHSIASNHCAPWASATPLEQQYHDCEWGMPCRDDVTLFEFLVLESAQAGLSWRLILQRREAYRQAFANFNPAIVANFNDQDEERLITHTGIIKNRRKVKSAINNAGCFLQVQQTYGSFADFLWSFVDNNPVQNKWQNYQDIPTQTALSNHLSKELKRQGFSFVGPVIVYAYMQAVGMVNDHLLTCPRHAVCAASKL